MGLAFALSLNFALKQGNVIVRASYALAASCILLFHLVLVCVFAYERMTWDTILLLFDMLSRETFVVPWGTRWIVLLTQSLPVLILPFAELQTIIVGYSISLAFPVLMALAVVLALRDHRGLLLVLIMAYFAAPFTFIWAISEVRAGVALAAILLMLLNRPASVVWRHCGLFLVGPIFYFTHPLALGLYAWVGVYYFLFIERAQGQGTVLAALRRRDLPWFAAFLVWTVSLVAVRYLTLAGYETGVIDASRPADRHLVTLLLGLQWGLIPFFALALVYLAALHRYLLMVFVLSSVVAWVGLMHLFVQGFSPLYLSHHIQPAVFFVAAAYCLALPPPADAAPAVRHGDRRLPPFVDRLQVAILICAILIGLYQVIALGLRYQVERGVLYAAVAIAAAQGIEKASLRSPCMTNLLKRNAKYIPVYSLLFSAARFERPIVVKLDDPAIDQRYANVIDRGEMRTRHFRFSGDGPWQQLDLGAAVADPLFDICRESPAEGSGPPE